MTATPTRSTAAVWRPGDPVGDRRFVAIGAPRPRARRRAARRDRRLRDVGDAVAVRRQRRARRARPDRRLPRRRRRRAGARVARLVAGADRPRAPRSTPTTCSSSPATCSAAARARTGPASRRPDGRPWGGRFPFVTVRDQVAAEVALADALGIRAVARRARWLDGRHARARVGGQPPRPRRARPRARLHALRHRRPDRLVPAAAARDPVRPGVPRRRLLRPRRLAGHRHGHRAADRAHHLPHEAELDDRFGRRPRDGEDPLGGGGRYDVESYLDHHAGKLARRFDPNCYVVLTEAMNSHDVGRGRGGPRRPPWPGYRRLAARRRRDDRPALPAAAVRGDRRGPRGVRARRSSTPRTGTTASSSRPSRWASSSTVR